MFQLGSFRQNFWPFKVRLIAHLTCLTKVGQVPDRALGLELDITGVGGRRKD